jgi:hypothetical protein
MSRDLGALCGERLGLAARPIPDDETMTIPEQVHRHGLPHAA